MAHKKGGPRGRVATQNRAAAPVSPVVAKAEPVPALASEASVEPARIPAVPAAQPVAAPSAPAAEMETAPIEPLTIALPEGPKTMTNETLNQTAATAQGAADRIQAAFGDVNERAKVAVEKGTKLLEEATELTKGNVEAFVASSKIAAKGVETLGQDAAEFGRKSFEQASAALKSLAEVKSPTDFFRLQSEFAKSAFDNLVAESSKVSEAVIKLAGEVAEPITSRYSVAAERVKTLAA